MDPSQTPAPADIPQQFIIDIWRGLIAGIISLIAWIAKRTVNRMSSVIEKLGELEKRLDRIEERSVIEFNRNSQMHVEMQHTIKELREAIMNLIYSTGNRT